MEKSIEKIRQAVMAYCEMLCPHESNKATLEVGILKRQSMGSVFYWLHVDGLSTIAIHDNATDDHIFAAYRLLGLSERDAVAAERAEMMKTVDALSAMVSVDPVSFAELEAKNAALVAALESLKRAVGYKPRRHGEIVLYRNDLGVFIDNTLAANEKGGKGE